ncbi:hypothetical protein DFJ73DRAFT_117586 [Zopfochytrium polystomum]|nr:hypothetical protein DFJ73DRAFT_117586 [Zopfochytrium polystomum]
MNAPSVVELRLEGNVGIESLADGLGRGVCRSPNMKSLKIRIWEDRLAVFVAGLNSAGENQLRYLELTILSAAYERDLEARWKLDLVVADAITALLPLKQLVSLTMRYKYNFGGRSDDRISHALERLSSSPLQSLILPWSPSDASVLHLIQILTNGANLRELGLHGALSVASVAALLAASPNCKLEVVPFFRLFRHLCRRSPLFASRHLLGGRRGGADEGLVPSPGP